MGDTYKPFALFGQFLEQVVGMETESFSAVHHFASQGNEMELSELINSGIDINEEDEEGLTALHRAAEAGNAKCVEILLQNGANINGKCSPLHLVANAKSAQVLFKAKASLNHQDDYGNSPLHISITKGRYELAEFFLSVGANVQLSNAMRETPLHSLCSSFIQKPHDEKLTQKMIDMGANVNLKDSQQRSPLHLAVSRYTIDKTNTVKILMESGASATDFDIQGMNPIHCLINKCRPYSEDDIKLLCKYFDLLVTNDNDANSKNAIGQTILHLAVLAGSPLQVLQFLVQRGCLSSSQDNQKRNLLHCLVERELDDDCVILNFLLDKDVDVNSMDVWGQTALHCAVEKNRDTLVQALLDRGADLNVKDSTGRQPLHIAAEKGRYVTCTSLITQGANINAQDNYNSTPLHFAAYGNKGFVADLLISTGCDVELRDACGQTSQDVAEMWPSHEFLDAVHEKHGHWKHESNQQKVWAKYGGRYLPLKTFQGIIESSGESLRMPGTLNDYLSSLISTPGIGTTMKDPEALEIRDIINNFAANVVKCLTESGAKMRSTLHHAGSSSEETKIKLPDEFDYVVCLDELSENIYQKHESEDVLESTNFVPNREASDQAQVLEKGVDYFETMTSVSNYAQIFLKDDSNYDYIELTHDLEKKGIPVYAMLNLFTHQLSNIIFDKRFPRDNQLVIKDVTNDPKFYMLWKGSRYKTLEIEVDFVPAVKLPSWPDKFRIQSPLLVPDLLKLPCLAVPKMAGERDFLWRCSLCLVETAIMRRCRNRIRNSFIAAKLLMSSAICPLVSFGDYEDAKMQFASQHSSLSSNEEFDFYEEVEDVMPSYILKMAFFHSIEEMARKDGLEAIFGESNQQPRDISLDVELDPEIVKDIFMKCDDWFSNQFVPSFFNPKQNVMGSAMLEYNFVKAQMYIKYILKLLRE